MSYCSTQCHGRMNFKAVGERSEESEGFYSYPLFYSNLYALITYDSSFVVGLFLNSTRSRLFWFCVSC